MNVETENKASNGEATGLEAEEETNVEVADSETDGEETENTAVAAANGERTIGEKNHVHIKVKPHPKFKEIYQAMLEGGVQRLATRNLTPGLTVYGERLIHVKNVEYRIWDAFRSKLAGAILKGIQTVPIEPGSQVLYLGAASGTTPSHVSDIIGEKGHEYCI